MKHLQLSSSPGNFSGNDLVVIIMPQEPAATSVADLGHHGTDANATQELVSVFPSLEEGMESVWSAQAYVALAIIFLLMTLTFIGNILIIVSVAKFKRLQIAPNYILVNLAVADIGLAIMMPFLFAINFLRDVEDRNVLCLVPYCLMSLLSGVSVLNLSIIAYDRYSALVEPLKYSSRVTSVRIAAICLMVWLYVTIVSAIPLVGWFYPLSGMNMMCTLNFYHNYTALAQVIAIFLPALVCMFFCYCRVMLVARHHTRAISAVQFSLFPGVLNKNYNMFKGNKYWRTLALILGVFTFTWGIFMTSVVVEVFCEKCAKFLTMHNYSGLLLLLNSSLNPWIYAYRNKDFRAAFSRVLRCFRKPCKRTLTRSSSNLVGERRNSRMSVALSRTNSLCGNLQTLQMLYEQEMALKNNNQQDFKNGEVETRQTSVDNSKVSVRRDDEDVERVTEQESAQVKEEV